MKCLLLIRRQLHYSCLEHGLVVLKTRYILFVIVCFFSKNCRERERERERERDPKSSVFPTHLYFPNNTKNPGHNWMISRHRFSE